MVLRCLEKWVLLSFEIDLNDGCVTVFDQRIGQNSLIQKKLCLCLDHNPQKPFTNNLLISSLLVFLKNYSFLNIISKAIVVFYQATLAHFLGGNCRYYPSCSFYAIEAFEKHKYFTALYLVFKRVFSCHPLTKKDNHDPVPATPKFIQTSQEIFS